MSRCTPQFGRHVQRNIKDEIQFAALIVRTRSLGGFGHILEPGVQGLGGQGTGLVLLHGLLLVRGQSGGPFGRKALIVGHAPVGGRIARALLVLPEGGGPFGRQLVFRRHAFVLGRVVLLFQGGGPLGGQFVLIYVVVAHSVHPCLSPRAFTARQNR